MRHGLILRFPDDEEARLLATARMLGLRDAFAEAPPHLSLAYWDGAPPEGLAEAAAPLAAECPLERLDFTGLGLFAGAPPILWLAPAPTPGLVQLQRGMLTLLARLPGAPAPHPHVAAGGWTPHVTLTTGGGNCRLGGLAAAAERGLPFRVRPDRVELVAFPPLETLAVLSLGASARAE